MNSQVAISRLSKDILNEILGFLYVDFIESIGVGEHHCSLLHPCVSIARSPAFQVFYNFRLVSSLWNETFENTVKYDGYPLHPLVQGPRCYQTRLYTSLIKSVIFKRYRVFHFLQIESASRGVFVAYDFGVAGGCKESREVVVKAWTVADYEFLAERRIYKKLSASPMKGFPSLIESNGEYVRSLFVVILEKLGPSLEDLRRLMPHKLFDEKMVLAVAIQMLDRYAALHSKGIIHNGAKPGNICLASLSSEAADATTLNVIDFGFSCVYNTKFANVPLLQNEEISGNKRFLSALSHQGYTQSQRDDLESLGYLFSALFHRTLPWDFVSSSNYWSIKMATPGSVLFREMDSSFLEYWRDVRSLAFGEVPDYCSMKSRFVQCWERKGFGNLPGEYDWLALFNKLKSADTLGNSVGSSKQTVYQELPAAGKLELPPTITSDGKVVDLTKPAHVNVFILDLKKTIDNLAKTIQETVAIEPLATPLQLAVRAIQVREDGLSVKDKVTIIRLFTEDESSAPTYLALIKHDDLRRQWLSKQLQTT